MTEEKLGITFKMVLSADSGAYTISDALRNAKSTGEHLYDIIANSTYSTIMYINEGILRDLTKCEYLDLDAPYWSSGFNRGASIGRSQYMASGAIALSMYRYMFVTFFNTKMFESNGRESLFDTVDRGEWTLDYQIELSDAFYSDLNGDLKKDEGDIYGFATNPAVYIDPYWASCDIGIITKDGDDQMVYSLDTERLSNVLDKETVKR